MSIVGKAAGPLGSFKAWITVNANRSATFSIFPAAKKIVSQTSTQIVYLVDEAQTYTVSATDGTFSKSTTVSITAKKQSKSATLNLFDIAIVYTPSGGNAVNITRNTTSAGSSSGNYQYSRSGENWVLYIRKSGTVKFSTLQTNVDYSVVGGGGGGGGGCCWGSSLTANGSRGGQGGGGTVTNVSNKSLNSSNYNVNIGAGGEGGAGGPDSRGTRGYSGTAGFSSSFNGTSSPGGANGTYASNDGNGTTNYTDSHPQQNAAYCFGSSSFERVSGAGSTDTAPSRCGQGGGGGSWDMAGSDPYTKNGKDGNSGLVAIRNKR